MTENTAPTEGKPGEMDLIAQIMELFNRLPEDKQLLALEKARQLRREAEGNSGEVSND